MKILVRLLAIAACLQILASCGGGVSSDNASSTTTFTVQPGSVEAYAGVEVLFTINGGVPPYTVSSNNALIAPVTTPIVNTKSFTIVPSYTTERVVTAVTVFDHAGTRFDIAMNVNPNLISNNVTITPLTGSGAIDCGASVCSGGTASVVMTLSSATQPVAGRQVRFEVEQGNFAFLQGLGSNLASLTYTTATDASGKANAIIRADAFAPSQLAVLRIVDIASGSVLRVPFTILRVTDGNSVITVIPSSAKVTGAFKGICTANVLADFYVAGGIAPYTFGSTFSSVASVVQFSLNTNDGYFTARTNGGCGSTIFTITDARGLTATATLEAVEGADPVPVIVIRPNTGSLSCGDTAFFTISGGIGPFVVSSTTNKVLAGISGRTVSAKRLAGDINTPPLAFPTTVPVFITVSDGTSNAQVQLSVIDDCP